MMEPGRVRVVRRMAAQGGPLAGPGSRVLSPESGVGKDRARERERLAALARAGEYAWGGAPIFGGMLTEEYVDELQGLEARRTAARMRRSDGQVRAVQAVISLPIRSTEWFLTPPEGASASEKEAAELLRANLWGGMEGSFDELVRECALAIYYGFRAPEVVWEERGGLAAVAKVAGRNPELIDRWLYDARAKLVGYRYRGSRPVGTGLSAEGQAGTEQVTVAVPLEKTLHVVFDRENDSPEGFGLWRSQYPHWYMKQAAYVIMGIGIERNLLGIPVAEMQQGAQPADKTLVLSILSRLRAAEDAAVVLPFGYKLAWFESQRSVVDAMPFVQHQDALIARAGLAQFLNLGTSGVGTQALAAEHVKVFLDQCDAHAGWIEGVLNSQLARRWCLLNYGPGIRPPCIRHRKIQALNGEGVARTLFTLWQGGFLTPGVEDETQLRELMELPQIEPAQLEKRRAARSPESKVLDPELAAV